MRLPTTLKRFTSWMAAGALGIAIASCSGDKATDQAPSSTTPEDVDTAWAIHALVGPPDEQRQVDVPPLQLARSEGAPGAWFGAIDGSHAAKGIENLLPDAEDDSEGGATPNSGNPSVSPGLHEQSDTSHVTQPLSGVDLADADDPAFFLIRAAAYECGMGLETTGNSLLPPGRPYPPWGESRTGRATYVFEQPPQSCSQLLAYQEVALCISQKLANVADAVDDVVWTKMPGGPVVIPPQANKDRFIVRDAAINALAAVAAMDMIVPPPLAAVLDEPQTCSQLFAFYTTNPGMGDMVPLLFHTTHASDYFPPIGVAPNSKENVIAMATSRLSFEAHTLRAGARLLEKLVRDSVYADMGTASQRRARAADPLRGARRAWGLADLEETAALAVQSSYGSLGHAARILQGRLEMGAAQPDPRCGGVGEMELLTPRVYGAALVARVEDRPIATTGQCTAANIVDASGVVLAPTMLEQTKMSELRPALIDQLVASAGALHGYTNDQDLTEFIESGQGAVIKANIEDLSDEDLRFGLERSFRRYQQMTGVDATVDEPIALTGLKSKKPVGSLQAFKPLVLDGALRCADLASDITSRAGGAESAAQCNEVGGIAGVLNADYGITTSHQDVFSLGQTFGRRLVVLRERANDAGLTEAGQPFDIANGAAAEIRAWAGPGRVAVTATARSGNPNLVGRTYVYLVGLQPKDLGAATTDEMADNIALVYGEPWVADCAVRLRTTCPDNFESDYVERVALVKTGKISAADSVTGTATSAITATTGMDGPLLRLTFRREAPEFAPEFEGASNPSKRLYVVQLHDREHPSRGLVLGAVALRTPYSGGGIGGGTSFAVSPRKWQLMNHSFGVARTMCSCEGSASEPPAYCIEGVSRNLFVPLENELTSDSDEYENSWKHYINLAAVAGQRADDLSKEMIEIGVQTDLRREAAMEELARECGEYTNLDDIPISQGDLDLEGISDGALAACLNDKKVDLVYLSEDPLAAIEAQCDPGAEVCPDAAIERAQKVARQTLGCLSELDDVPPGAKETNPICGQHTISHAGLNLVPAAPADTTDPVADREDVLSLIDGLRTGHFEPAKMAKLARHPWATSDRLELALRTAHLDVDGDGEWRLFAQGHKIMDSVPSVVDEPVYWPGCNRVGSGVACSESALAEDFERMFRVPADGSEISAIERDRILWQLEGALWTLAGVARIAPDSLFRVPVVAADFSSPNAPANAPVFSVFGRSQFTDEGYLIEGSDRDTSTLGQMLPLTSTLRPGSASPFGGGSPDEAEAALSAIGFDQGYRFGIFSNAEVAIGYQTAGDASKWWEETSKLLASASCTSLAGGDASSALRDRVAARKVALPGIAMCSLRGGQQQPTLVLKRGNDGNAKLGFNNLIGGGWMQNEICEDSQFAWRGDSIIPNWPMTVTELSAATACFSQASSEGLLSHPNGTFPYQYWTSYPCQSLQCSLSSRRCFRTTEYPNEEPGYGWSCFACAANDPSCIQPCELASTECVGVTQPDLSKLCPAEIADGVPMIGPACTEDIVVQNAQNIVFDFTRRELLPTSCTPRNRVPAFVNSYPPRTSCMAAWQATQAFALAFYLGATNRMLPALDDPPEIRTVEDLDHAVRWIDRTAENARGLLRGLYLEQVPQRVIDDYTTGRVGTGSLRGNHGTLVLELEKSLQLIADSWGQVAGDLEGLRDALDAARISIVRANLAHESEVTRLAIQRSQIYVGMAQSVAAAISACSPTQSVGMSAGLTGPSVSYGMSFNMGACIAQSSASDSSLEQSSYQLGEIDSLDDNSEAQKENEVIAALNHLEMQAHPLYTDMNRALGQARTATADALAKAHALVESEQKARYEVSKGTGQDFFIGDDGQPVMMPVNTVLRRQYDITKIRYENALREAKYYAYLARLAIEQRIGKRLNTITENVGVLDPPAMWADDVCSLVGVDYAELRECDISDADGGTGSSSESACAHDKEIIAKYADQYIGDYVAKLQSFVEFYNVEYPSHEGDDTAILSFADDFLATGSSCLLDTPNLLYYSAELQRSDLIKTDEMTDAALHGWRLNPCGDGDLKCLRVDAAGAMNTGTAIGGDAEPGSAGQGGLAPPVDGVNSGVTWLHEEMIEIGEPDDGEVPAEAGWPRSVTQELSLVAGRFVLSWWDQARAFDGAPLEAGAAPPGYRVELFGSDGYLVPDASFTSSPYVDPTGEGGWSPRHTLVFDIDTAGRYTLVVGASTSLTEPGSIALSNMQLEPAGAGDQPTVYIGTTWSRKYVATDCPPGASADLQSAFERRCDSTGCFYEFGAPIVIDTLGLATGRSKFTGKLAAGNYNYRHRTLAVNLVGTGVHDCSDESSMSCYGSGYTEYTLVHDAFDVAVVSWNGDISRTDAQHFNFGQAAIRHGKALAAERYISLPLGTADQSLVSQSGILKEEMRGRPLDGSYRLRIWENPDLHWHRLEDVQLILNYRYWSVIEPHP